MTIVFADPPPKRGAGSTHPWQEIADQLKQRPHEWALCVRGTTSTPASAIKAGKYVAFRPAGSFDARSVGTLDGKGGTTYDIYIRYIGGDTDE